MWRVNRKQGGFSLIEVMVSGVIMSSGLAGIAALLLSAVAGTSDSADRSTASLLAGSMVSLAEISPAARDILQQLAPEMTPDCSPSHDCSTTEFAAYNLKLWQAELARQLPGGKGTLCRDSTPGDGSISNFACDGEGSLQVKVFWARRPGSSSLEPRLVKLLP